MKRDEQRRLFDRVGCSVRGRIVDDESCVTECKIMDVSAGGAWLEVPYSSHIKSKFTLFVPSKGIERQVEVVWHASYELGVQFLP